MVIVNNTLIDAQNAESNVMIPYSVIRIGDDAFSEFVDYFNNERLTSVIISDSITNIGKEAFFNCKRLTNVTISSSVNFVWKEVFNYKMENVVTKCVTPDFEIIIKSKSAIENQINMIHEKGFTQKISGKIKNEIIWQMFMQKPDDPDIFAYIKKNHLKMIRSAIDINDLTVIDLICARNDILNSKNIDKPIEYAIQNTQNGGSHEIQIMLINYKNDNIGFSDIKFEL